MSDTPAHAKTGARETLAVIVPCLNEEANIAVTVRSIEAVAPTLDLDLEIHMIDDGSTDGTLSVMRRLAAEVPSCYVHVNAENKGLGRSTLEAYDRLPPEYWGTVVPGDNEIIFESIKNHLAIRHEYDVVLGYLQNSVIRPFVRRMASASFTRTVQLVYGYQYRYLNGLKLYRISTFRGLEVISGGHGYNAELLAKAQLRDPHMRVGEAPFLARGRATGWSKAFSVRNLARSVRELYSGYRSVIDYREKVIRRDDDS